MLMLRTLLAQRFHLSVRIETKDLPVYAITVAKGGPKFAKAEVQEKDCTEDSEPAHTPCHVFNGGQGRGLHGKAVDMDDLAGFVQNWTDRPVIDKTALQGLFAVESEGWAPIVPRQEPGAGGEEGFSDPTRPTLFMIFDRLGLKLESRRAPVNLYIIERVEKPTEN